jgi:hypothetical protein
MKIQLSVITMVLAFFILSSCSKKLNENGLSDFETKTDQLSKDSSFKNIIELENNLSEEIEKVLITKNMTKNDFYLLIEKIKNQSKSDSDFKNKLTENDLPELYNILKNFKASFNGHWVDLEMKYNRLSSNIINVASNKYFENNELKKIYSVNKKTFSINNDNIAKACGWGYSLCLAGATAGAILCHAGCIGGTAGLGAPVCVLLCGTIQVSVGAACMSSYCEEN